MFGSDTPGMDESILELGEFCLSADTFRLDESIGVDESISPVLGVWLIGEFVVLKLGSFASAARVVDFFFLVLFFLRL